MSPVLKSMCTRFMCNELGWTSKCHGGDEQVEKVGGDNMLNPMDYVMDLLISAV